MHDQVVIPLRAEPPKPDVRFEVCVAVCCSVLQFVDACCSVLQCVAVCCRVFQCVAVCRNVLQESERLVLIAHTCGKKVQRERVGMRGGSRER